jgi:hypothetical protein
VRRLDLAGQQFGYWTVLSHDGGSQWICRCKCGTEKSVQRNHLRSGHSQSCGCLKAEVSSKANSAQLVGQKFGRLTVTARDGSNRPSKRASNAMWLCLCECGGAVRASSWKLTSGYVRSCGCLFKDAITTHGMSRTRTYRIWAKMRGRCLNPNDDNWRNYGGRGVGVCARWETFANFLADMGEAPTGLSLDRMDVNGDYGPHNCRWATRKQQAKNTRRNKFVTIDGERMSLAEAIASLRSRAEYRPAV